MKYIFTLFLLFGMNANALEVGEYTCMYLGPEVDNTVPPNKITIFQDSVDIHEEGLQVFKIGQKDDKIAIAIEEDEKQIVEYANYQLYKDLDGLKLELSAKYLTEESLVTFTYKFQKHSNDEFMLETALAGKGFGYAFKSLCKK